MDKNLDKPECLSPAGARAYDAIISHLDKNEMIDYISTGGCKAFYSPEEWSERRELYGTKSVLVVVYDGGDLRRSFNMDEAYDHGLTYLAYLKEEGIEPPSDFNAYKSVEKMQESLRLAGFYAEECTGWYAAIYEI